MECCGKSLLKEKYVQILCGEDCQKEEDGKDLCWKSTKINFICCFFPKLAISLIQRK